MSQDAAKAAGLGDSEFDKLAKMFVYLDKDGSDTLSKEEMDRGFQKKGFKEYLETLDLGCMHTFLQHMMDSDKDQSGQLDFGEFLDYIEEKRGGKKIEGRPAYIDGAKKALLRDLYDAIDSGEFSDKGNKLSRDTAGDGISQMEFKRAFMTSKKIQKLLIKTGFCDQKYSKTLFSSFKDAADEDGAEDENPARMSFDEFCKFCADLNNYVYAKD